jgi:hypothetical protein
MVALSTLNEASLYRFLKEHGDNHVKRELLLFWGCHPNAKFARHIICYALDCGKLEMDRALRALVKAGLVDTHILNDATFYSLTADEERRRRVVELSSLDWDQWHLMVNRIEQGQKAASSVSGHIQTMAGS